MVPVPPGADEGVDFEVLSSWSRRRSASTASFAPVTAIMSRSTVMRSRLCAMMCLAQRMPLSGSNLEFAGSAISANTMSALRPSSPIISRVADGFGSLWPALECVDPALSLSARTTPLCVEDGSSDGGAMSLSQGFASFTGTGRSSVRKDGRSSSVLSNSRCHALPSSAFSASLATE